MVTLRIVEQPARYHRFRYETEIAGGKLGGLLYGRSGSKSCVRLALKGIDPTVHKSVTVICGTVNPQGYPHPFYMHGEGCDSGVFHWRREVTPADGKKAEIEICLEKVSLVCVPQGGDRLQQAIKKRESIAFNPFNKNISEAKYTSKNVRELRLAFQVFYVDKAGVTVPCKTAIEQTDVISDIKFQTKLEIEDIHPNQSCLRAKEQLVWALFKDQLPHLDASQFSAFLDFEGAPLVQCEIRSVKKQLMMLCVPQLALEGGNERLECSLRVNDLKSDVTAEYPFVLWSFCNQCGVQLLRDSENEPEPKRQRVSNGGNASAPPSGAAEDALCGRQGDEDSHQAASREPDMLVLSVVREPSNSAIVKPELTS